MTVLSRLCALVFGASMIVLSFAIALEAILRKFFSLSLGGVDELGGYAIAVAAPLAFLVAASEQAHIRINLLHTRLPLRARATLNAVSAVSLALLAAFLLYFTLTTVTETLQYRSIAQTPWATPLIYPQAVWLLAMSVFTIGVVAIALRALLLLLRGDWAVLDRRYGPGTAEEELEEELADLKTRERAAP